MDEFDYFMIRVRRPTPGPPDQALSGIVECLGTGVKQTFASSEELLRFVGGEPNLPVNMTLADGSGNETVS